MKSFFNFYILIFGTILLGFSCTKDFLNKKPISNLTEENYFSSEVDFNSAVLGSYASFRNIHSGLWVTYLEFRSDNMDVINTSGTIPWSSSNNVWEGVDTKNLWDALFQLISRSNFILKNIHRANFNQELVAQFKGEALFFRGWAYFACVRIFGGIPIIAEDAPISAYYTTPRASIEETYNKAEQDLLESISLLPLSYSAANYGRITQFAAKGIMSRLYLQKTGWPLYDRSSFSKAVPMLKDIVEKSQYGFHPDFKGIFSMQQEKGKEMIITAPFTSNQGMLNANYASTFIPKAKFPGNSALFQVPVRSFFDSFEPGDIRKFVSIDTVFTNISGNVVKQLNINKFFYGLVPSLGFEFDVPVLRFTDVLLMYAEALCGEANDVKPEALNILNMVRNRAGLASLSITDYNTFRTQLFKERRNEFFFEGIRWFDLLRNGDAIDALKIKGKNNVSETWFLFPIPRVEIDKIPDILIQNPGYN